MTGKPEGTQQRATAEMVARAAQVSRAAVSRAFNPQAPLKPEKRARILKIAEELSYTPDRAARALVTRRSHLVGVIVPDVCSPWESQEVDALTTALQAEGFATLLFKTRIDSSMDETLLTYMRGFNPDSVIVFTENVRPHMLSRFLDRAVPIYVNYLMEREGDGTLPHEPDALCDRIDVNQWEGMEQAVALLAGYGCRRIAYLSGKPESLGQQARRKTLEALMARRGLPAPVIVPGDFSYDRGYAGTLDLFRLEGGADAVFAANDESAFGALDALRYELKLRVPEDVKVIGFDDITQSHWRSYNLTTVKVDLEARVRALVRLIQRRLKAPNAPALAETVHTRLAVRGTVG
ncbi:LacI family DNA-binding transcriptional regulator [Chelativorans salis]|uniref:LacI family DNA-binding transcriptional regulator n=1 Tax=Chelativorans salis TaxID=2978478 RepID=A0ABT2LV60_9HYPH|nr:LacI family DNA-binding transcriptional regulator [Chelativorans sp. EGI FJ00035]MCT7378410.1 LacI family DNA-binding transcriptional regulator [Chelativorans sp. EGI FJ00035]